MALMGVGLLGLPVSVTSKKSSSNDLISINSQFLFAPFETWFWSRANVILFNFFGRGGGGMLEKL